MLRLHLSKLELERFYLCVKGGDLHSRLLVCIFCVREVVDYHLILIVPTLQFYHMFTCLSRIELALLHDSKRIHLLADLPLSDLVLDLFNVVFDDGQVLLLLRQVRGILIQLIKTTLEFLSLAHQCLLVVVCFLDLGVEKLKLVVFVTSK